jgi:hypothetical protein
VKFPPSSYVFRFSKEFAVLQSRCDSVVQTEDINGKIPVLIALIHCLFSSWALTNLCRPSFVIAGFQGFLAFAQAAKSYENDHSFRSPVLVGVLAGSVTFGGLQEWRISPAFRSLKEIQLFTRSTILTAFNDNAALTYLIMNYCQRNFILLAIVVQRCNSRRIYGLGNCG